MSTASGAGNGGRVACTIDGGGAGAAAPPMFSRATQVLTVDRANPCAAIRRVNGPRWRPMRRIAVRVAGTGSDESITSAVKVRVLALTDGTRMRLNTGAAIRSV